MKKEIKEIKDGVMRVTTTDERWYSKATTNPVTGLPDISYIPSVTWIAGYYPKGIQFYKWLAEKGWDESQAIKSAAGDKGSKVHYAIEDMITNKKEVKIDDKYVNPSTDQPEELTVEEYNCLMSFTNWFNAVKPKVLANEITGFNDKIGYAGTSDLICEIDGQKWLIDFKTGQNVWPEWEIQISAYRHFDSELVKDCKLAILQVGYNRNKVGYKFTEVLDQFPIFLAARQIWAKECEGIVPKQRDYPLSLKLVLEPVVEVEKVVVKKPKSK